MSYTEKQRAHIAESLSPITERALYARYDEILDECYEVTTIGYLEYDSSYVLKCCDKTAYNCGYNDYLDSEIGESITDEIGGEYYDLEEVNCLLEDFDEADEVDTDNAGDKDDAFVT